MNEWHYDEELEGYELVIPDDRLYLLSEAAGATVWAEGESHEDVTWFVDFSRLVKSKIDSVQSRRYVTTEPLDETEAKAWALAVSES